jgi:Caspase domain
MAVATNMYDTAHAQNYYHFVYEIAKAKEVIICKALVVLQPDGTATSRVQYNAGENKQLFLYEQALLDSTDTAVANENKYLMPYKQAEPQVKEDPGGFVNPRFLFEKKYDSTGYYYAPAGVEVSETGKDWAAAKTTTAEQKTYEELRRDEPFVGSFYFESEAFYQYIFDQQTRDVPLVRSEQLFLFVVANTNDATVGASAKTDLQNVSRLFTRLAQDLGIAKVFPLYIAGEAYSKMAVEAALAVLETKKPSAKDIVIFYFSGHGFRLPGDTSIYPRMSFRTAKNKANQEVGDNLGLEEVYNRITALKPGVALVLGDCCNADIFENPVFGQDMIRPKGGGVLGNFNAENGKKLFFPPAPIAMIIGSVNKGHLSVGHPQIGGYFTHYFTSELEKNLWGYYSNSRLPLNGKSNASWLRMLVTARQNTFQKSRAKQCGKTENDRCIQLAEISVNPPQ